LRSVLANPPADIVIALDADDPAATGPRHRRTEFRRDQPRSRRRWQFDLREEAVLGVMDP
jgi:CRISPR system Cascade subunit CasD